MIVVTGGAGLIGSTLVWLLNERGNSDIVIVDDINHDEKEHNIGHLQYEEMVGIADFREQLLAGDWNDRDVEAILHMGACSDTSETNWGYLEDNNVEYSQDIIRWCFDNDVRCVYASSAATYGDGSQGYNDDHELFDQLKPLNLYGKSKLLVDIWARDGEYLDKVVGVRYFNVFGPNEWHKEGMRSLVTKKYPDLVETGKVSLFKSANPDYADGEQMRDFVYVKDAAAMTLWFLDNLDVSGVFNVGAGKAQSWNDIANAMIAANDGVGEIEYIDMPEKLAEQYQYFTEADMTKLKEVGGLLAETSLEDAVRDSVQNYLAPHRHLGE